MPVDSHIVMTPRLVAALYTEAMVLADEARSYFQSGRFFDEADPQDQDLPILYSCESLKITTRLMHAIAWLLNQRALAQGELSEAERWQAERRLGQAQPVDWAVVERFPAEAQMIARASDGFFRRIQRLESRLLPPRHRAEPAASNDPVGQMLERLSAAF